MDDIVADLLTMISKPRRDWSEHILARAATEINTLREQLAGDGTRFAVVPIEPTEAMYYAGLAVEPGIGGSPPSPRHVWAAMVKAAQGENT